MCVSMYACILYMLFCSLGTKKGNTFWETEINVAFSIYFSNTGTVMPTLKLENLDTVPGITKEKTKQNKNI